MENGSNPKVSVLNCIDLSGSDIHCNVSLFKQACLDCGFCYVVNHGIGQEFMDEVFAQSKRFFDMPLSEKMKLLKNNKHRGYTPFFDSIQDRVNQVHGDHKEGYYIGVVVAEDDPDAKKPFFGPNVWPNEETLPDWRETMEKYHRKALHGVDPCLYTLSFHVMELANDLIFVPASRVVAKKVVRVIALALDLDVDFFDKPDVLGKPIANLRLLHYEGQSDLSKGIFGSGAHSDFGLVTLLATDNVLGLQICKDKDAKPQIWEYVPPLKGAFIVNLGDLLERWSNGIFRSTLHRVLGNGQERYSIACFVDPNHDCVIQCLPTCTSEKNPPKFAPIKCEAYMSQRYKDTHTDLEAYTKSSS